MYYKEHIPLILRDDINTLDNCLVTEIRQQNVKCFLIFTVPRVKIKMSSKIFVLMLIYFLTI